MTVQRDITNYWQARLAAVCTKMQIGHAALILQDQQHTISVEYAQAPTVYEETGKQYSALCVAKLFTSALIMLLVLQRKLEFTSLLVDLLPQAPTADVLRGISVAHLLSHTHGLSDGDLRAAPTNSAGFIDIESVGVALQRGGRLFTPGKYFSYGTAGYILLGSVIEVVTQKPFGKVLYEEILRHLTCEKNASLRGDSGLRNTAICPSSGGGMTLSPDWLLTFARNFAATGTSTIALPEAFLTKIFSTRQPLPGWSPIFSGCCYGWKDFANGWFGHNGINNEQLTYVRVNRELKAAICLVAESARQNPGALPSLLFRTAYPALCFSTSTQPRFINEPHARDWETIVGNFGRGYLSFHITAEQNKLSVEIRTTAANHVVVAHRCYLRAAQQNIYFLEKPWQNITFLQLITDEDTRRYLWDHTQLWPELEVES